jgi:transcription termination factor Rho
MTRNPSGSRREAGSGFRRVEVTIPKEHAELLRRIARALAEDSQEADAIRKLIDESVKKPMTFEEWMRDPAEE